MKNNFIDNYATYSSGNEASHIYHKWSAISCLSSAISRRVWFDFGQFVHYANLYVILVGDPGNGKSTAMSMGRRMVRQLTDIQVAPPSITKEALTQLMGDEKGPCVKSFELDDEPFEYSHLTMFANEIVTLLNTGGNAIGMIEFFTDIWDQPVFEYKTKGSGTDVIKGPFVTLLGCMTPEQTGQMLKDNIISGGFSRRCLFVLTKDRGKPVPRPMTTPEQLAAEAECVEWLTMLGDRKGVFSMTKRAEDFYDKWYYANHATTAAQTSPVMKSYHRTKDCLLIKVSMLYALGTDYEMAAGNKPLVLDIPHFEFVLEMFAEVEPNISKVFEGFGRNVLSDISARLLNAIDAQGGYMTEKQIRSHMWDHASTEEMDDVLKHLHGGGQLKRSPVINGGVTYGYAYHYPDIPPPNSTPKTVDNNAIQIDFD